MSLSGINKYRRSLKQTSWIIENILNKRGKRKQRPVVVDVLKHVCRQKDGSLVREVSDGEAYITAIFSNDAVKACLEEHDGCNPPDWDRALLLVTKYCVELQHQTTLAESEYVLHINSFRIWDLQEGFNRKKKIIFCMDDSRVKERAQQQWEELNRQMEPCSAESSMHLTQLLQEMAKDESQTMENGSITTVKHDFTLPSKTPLDRLFSIKEFIISPADSKILDNIAEWKDNYKPITDSRNSPKSSVNSLPNITSGHTLIGQISSEEPLGKENDDIESIHLSCSDPSEKRNSEEKQLDKSVSSNSDVEKSRDVGSIKRGARDGMQCSDKSSKCVDIPDFYPSTQPFNPCLTPEKSSEPDSGSNSLIKENLTLETDSLLGNKSSEYRTCDRDHENNVTHKHNNTFDSHVHDNKGIQKRSPPQKKRKIGIMYSDKVNSCENSSWPLVDQDADFRLRRLVSGSISPEQYTSIKTSTPLPVDDGRNGDVSSSGSVLISADNCSFNSLISSEQESSQNKEELSQNKEELSKKSRCEQGKSHRTISYPEISPNKHITNASCDSLEDLHLISPGIVLGDDSIEKVKHVDKQQLVSGFTETSEGFIQSHETVEEECIVISSEERSVSPSFLGLSTEKSGAADIDGDIVVDVEENIPSMLNISHGQHLCTQLGSSPVYSSNVGHSSVNGHTETTRRLKDTDTSQSGLVLTEINSLSDGEENQQVGNNIDLKSASQIRRKLLDSLEYWDGCARGNLQTLEFPENLVCQMIDYFTNI